MDCKTSEYLKRIAEALEAIAGQNTQRSGGTGTGPPSQRSGGVGNGPPSAKLKD